MANKLQICTWLLETCHRIPGEEMPSGMVAVFLTAFHRLSWDGSSWSWPYVLLGPVTERTTVRLMFCLQAEICRTVCWSYCPGQPAAIQHTINLISSRHYIRINLIKFYSHTVSLYHTTITNKIETISQYLQVSFMEVKFGAMYGESLLRRR